MGVFNQLRLRLPQCWQGQHYEFTHRVRPESLLHPAGGPLPFGKGRTHRVDLGSTLRVALEATRLLPTPRFSAINLFI